MDCPFNVHLIEAGGVVRCPRHVLLAFWLADAWPCNAPRGLVPVMCRYTPLGFHVDSVHFSCSLLEHCFLHRSKLECNIIRLWRYVLIFGGISSCNLGQIFIQQCIIVLPVILLNYHNFLILSRDLTSTRWMFKYCKATYFSDICS